MAEILVPVYDSASARCPSPTDLIPLLEACGFTAGSGGTPVRIVGIDLRPTGNPNEFTVEIGWIDSDNAAQTTTDLSPVVITGTGTTSALTDNSDGTYTHDNDITTQDIDTRADSNPYDPAGTSLAATTVGDAIDEMANSNQPYRVAGPVGAGGAQAQPTINDDVAVADSIQHTGDVMLGGFVGAPKNEPTSKLEILDGGITVTNTNAETFISSNAGSLLDEQRYRLANRATTASISGYLRIHPAEDDNFPNKDGIFVDRRGNFGLATGFGTWAQKAGAEKVYSDSDFAVSGFSEVFAPTAPWDTVYVHRWTKVVSGIAEFFVMDGAGNVTQLSSHNVAVAELLGLSGLGHSINSYNVFSGIGEGVDPTSGRKVVYEIDAGAYRVESSDGKEETAGVDERLAYGQSAHAPLSAIEYKGERGMEFFEYVEEMREGSAKTAQAEWDEYANKHDSKEKALADLGPRPSDYVRQEPNILLKKQFEIKKPAA